MNNQTPRKLPPRLNYLEIPWFLRQDPIEAGHEKIATMQAEINALKSKLSKLGWRLHNKGKIVKSDWMEIVANQTQEG